MWECDVTHFSTSEALSFQMKWRLSLSQFFQSHFSLSSSLRLTKLIEHLNSKDMKTFRGSAVDGLFMFTQNGIPDSIASTSPAESFAKIVLHQKSANQLQILPFAFPNIPVMLFKNEGVRWCVTMEEHFSSNGSVSYETLFRPFADTFVGLLVAPSSFWLFSESRVYSFWKQRLSFGTRKLSRCHCGASPYIPSGHYPDLIYSDFMLLSDLKTKTLHGDLSLSLGMIEHLVKGDPKEEEIRDSKEFCIVSFAPKHVYPPIPSQGLDDVDIVCDHLMGIL